MAGQPTLLIVTYHFPPSAASGTFRTLGFVQHLPAAGWRAVVVAPPAIPWEPADPKLADRIPPQTVVRYVPYPGGRVLNPYRRLVGAFEAWLAPAAWACLRAVRRERPAAVLTSGPPHCVHWLGRQLKRWSGLPWVADFRDPWMANDLDRKTKRGKAAARGERAVMAHADLVLANAPGAAAGFRTAYPEYRDKVAVLTNGFDPPAEAVPPPAADGPVRVLHAGELYAGRDPRPYLDALAALRADGGPDVRTCLIGRAAPKADAGFDLGDEVRARRLADAVEVRGQVPYAEALAEMRRTDVQLLLDTPGRTTGVPAKLYEYFGANRPVLALAEPDGDTAAVLRGSGILHRVAPPRDVPAIRRAVAELADAVRAGRPAVTDPAALGRFTRAALAGELAAHLNRITGRPAPGPT